jgi:hypothetical protein
MKLMKVVYNMKNILNQEFEQRKESKLIEVMKMKMHKIQVLSIVNLIQMKLMKVIFNLKKRAISWNENPIFFFIGAGGGQYFLEIGRARKCDCFFVVCKGCPFQNVPETGIASPTNSPSPPHWSHRRRSESG